MYENITYAEIKKLPEEQKSEAWKELQSLYPSKKELAAKLNVSTAAVYNMIAKYVDGKPIGRKKKDEQQETVEKPRKTRTRGKKQKAAAEQTNAGTEANIAAAEIQNVETAPEGFSIIVKKIIMGEDAQFLLNGIGSTLLKNQKYSIEVKVDEKK